MEEEEEEYNNNSNNNNNSNAAQAQATMDDLALPSVEAVGVRHSEALLGVAGEVPLDVARTILSAHYRTLRAANASGRQRVSGGFIQCQSCSTPWIAGLWKPRLLGSPRDPRAKGGRLRRITRRARTRPSKLSASEKSILARHRNRENAIEVSCLVCRRKKCEVFPLPEKRRRRKTEEEEEEEEECRKAVRKKKKKKKRRGKELNAGLILPSSSSSSSSSTQKKGREGDGRDAPPIFTTASREPAHTHTNTHARTHRNNSKHPRFKASTKVSLTKDDAPGAPLPHPASAPTPGQARERKRTLTNLRNAMSKEKRKAEASAERNQNSLGSFLNTLF